MKRAGWTHRAADDLREIQTYLGHFSPALARDALERPIAAGRFLTEFPAVGTPMTGRWRKWRVPGTHYLLIYRPTRTGVEIGRVRQDRSNWGLVP